MDCIEIEHYVSSRMTPERFEHCKSTATQTQELLRRYHAPHSLYKLALLTGLWHDIAREWTDADLLTFRLSPAIKPQLIEIQNPMLLHGAVAAELLRAYNPQVTTDTLLAIRWHTLGSPEMRLLGAALYIADYLEPIRKHITHEERAELLQIPSIEQLCLRVAQKHLGHIHQVKKIPAGSTIALIAFLENGGRF